MPTPIKVALAAYGMSGRIFHAPFLATNPHFELALILERSKTESRALYPSARIVRYFEAITSDSSIDLVVVNTPNTLHYSMAKAALLAGKHVVVEKPFTNTVEEGRELVELARDRGLMLSVYHNRRLQAGFKTARRILTEGRLGKLVSYQINVDRYRPQPGPKKWKEEQNPGAGLLYDLGPHLIDEALCLFGEPQALYADLRVARPSGQVCDDFYLRLDYPEHKAILSASLLAREPAPAYVIHGEQGSYIKQGQDVQEQRLVSGVQPTEPDWAKETEADWGLLHDDLGRSLYCGEPGSYQDYYHNIAEHLLEGEPLLVLPKHALKVIELIEVAERSAREGRRITRAEFH